MWSKANGRQADRHLAGRQGKSRTRIWGAARFWKTSTMACRTSQAACLGVAQPLGPGRCQGFQWDLSGWTPSSPHITIRGVRQALFNRTPLGLFHLQGLVTAHLASMPR